MYTEHEFFWKFMNDVMALYNGEKANKTQASVAEEISEKYGVHFTEDDIRKITQSYGFSHHIKDNNKKPAFICYSSALDKKIHKAWEKASLQNE
ncbi:MAG: hypothetical protein MR586_02215 [Megasphaera elsdenii]|nr:hypothetical protein [Megasphaera elsdenii]